MAPTSVLQAGSFVSVSSLIRSSSSCIPQSSHIWIWSLTSLMNVRPQMLHAQRRDKQLAHELLAKALMCRHEQLHGGLDIHRARNLASCSVYATRSFVTTTAGTIRLSTSSKFVNGEVCFPVSNHVRIPDSEYTLPSLVVHSLPGPGISPVIGHCAISLNVCTDSAVIFPSSPRPNASAMPTRFSSPCVSLMVPTY